MSEQRRCEIDWTRWYGPGAGRPPSEHLFLADAVHLAGEALCMPYDRAYPIASMLPQPPAIVIPDEEGAFEGEVPIAAVHDLFGDHVREVLASAPSAGAEARETDLIRRMWPDRWELVGRDLSPGPAGPITRAEWEQACDEIVERTHFGGAARAAMRTIADAIASLAFAGEIRTFIRPFDGALADEEIDRDLWRVSTPLRRLASCAMSMAAPFDPDAAPTHHIFVARAGLRPALARYAETHAVALTSEQALSTDPDRSDRFAELIERTTNELRAIVGAAPDYPWRKPELLKALALTPLGTVEPNILDAARANLFAEFPKLKRGGAPRGPRVRSAEIEGATGRVPRKIIDPQIS